MQKLDMYTRTFLTQQFIQILIDSSQPPAAEEDNWFRDAQRGNAQRTATMKFELPLARRDDWFPGVQRVGVSARSASRQQNLIDSWATPRRGSATRYARRIYRASIR